MVDQLARLVAWLQTREGRKLFRYTMTSVISTAVSFVVLFIVYGVFRAWSEVPSTVFANAVATVPSYWLNRNWAWGKTGRSHIMREVVPFWAMSAFGIAFSIVGASAARDVGQIYHLGHVPETALVLVANVTSFGIFWVLKFLLFNRLFHVPLVLDGIDEAIEPESAAADVR